VILLIGRSGQVGWELESLLKKRKAEFVAGSRDDFDLLKPDDLRAKLRATNARVIVNAAAYTAVDAAEKEEPVARTINADAPAVLAEEAKRMGALLIHYSTDYVFDGSSTTPYREDDPVNPVSAYGRTKLVGEEAIRTSGCRHVILRTAWVYAPRGKNFVLTMLRLANERDEIKVVADQIGSPTSARSLAAATLQTVAAVGDKPLRQTYHATGEGVTSWHGFAQRIVDKGSELGLCRRVPVLPIKTSEYPTPAKRPAYSVLDNGRLAAELGVRLPGWEQALDECLAEIASEKRPRP
jgi:dTDP-4-dehydrorhamnose reductase